MEDEGDRANEDLKKKDERRQQKLLMKNKSIADQAKAAAADAVAVMKKIITEMPPAVLLSAEEKHKSNPYNVRVNVEELAARMEEVAKADNKLMRGRRKQVAKNSDDDDDEDEDDQVAEPQSAQASSSPTMGESNSSLLMHFQAAHGQCRITFRRHSDSHAPQGGPLSMKTAIPFPRKRSQ